MLNHLVLVSRQGELETVAHNRDDHSTQSMNERLASITGEHLDDVVAAPSSSRHSATLLLQSDPSPVLLSSSSSPSHRPKRYGSGRFSSIGVSTPRGTSIMSRKLAIGNIVSDSEADQDEAAAAVSRPENQRRFCEDLRRWLLRLTARF